MPELPEVETVRASLGPMILGSSITRVHIDRFSVFANAPAQRRQAGRALGTGQRLVELCRLGKQLALVLDSGSVVLIHLGMTGQLFVRRACTTHTHDLLKDHVHIRWVFGRKKVMCFRDPRRFGGVWAYDSLETLWQARWSLLGPDALTIRTADLCAALGSTQRTIKACLLDQRVLAGVGNIYADESLFLAGIDPRSKACQLPREAIRRLARCIRGVLSQSIRAGGSTLRDFVDANANPGYHQIQFRVYSRSGQPCSQCAQTLASTRLAQRMTVWCPGCQRLWNA